MNLEELCAREQIREVLYSYCRGLDRGDVKLIEGVYHPDATDYHGTFKGLGREFASHIVASMDHCCRARTAPSDQYSYQV